MEQIVIIGAGASAVGTIIALKELGIKDNNIIIYRSENKKKIIKTNYNFKKLLYRNDYKKIYSILKKKFGFSLIQKKTSSFNYLENIKHTSLLDNNFEYGFTSFWGGSVQVFDKKTAKKNSFNYSKLLKGYNKILNHIYITKGIKLNKSIDKIKSNSQIKIDNNLKNFLNKFQNSKDIKCTINSIAINSKSTSKNELIINDNLIGSTNNKIFNSKFFFRNLKKIKIKKKTVKNISFFKKKILLNNNFRKKFKKIFFCSGPYQTQKILANNFKEFKKFRVKDTYCFNIPILYLGKQKNKSDNYFSLTNLIINFKKNLNEVAQAQIYPPQKHIFFSIFHHYLWNTLGWLYKYLFKRVYFARVYLTEKYCIIRSFDLKTDKILVKTKMPNSYDVKNIKKYIFLKMKNALKGTDFKILNIKISSKTSTHYAGKVNTRVLNDLAKNQIFINDSTCWKFLPSYSPTLTIMTQAYINTLKAFK